jgi:hypothetical protein
MLLETLRAAVCRTLGTPLQQARAVPLTILALLMMLLLGIGLGACTCGFHDLYTGDKEGPAV